MIPVYKKTASTSRVAMGKPAVKKPVTPKPPSPTTAIDIEKYRTNNTQLTDLKKQYGLDYSRNFAQQQAQAMADAKRTGLNTQMKQVNENVNGANDALSRNNFQQYMNQAQSQVGAGINGGMQADQNMRLAMSRQAAMGNIYRDAATQKSNISANMANVGKEQVAEENRIYNERLQEAFQNAMADTQARRSENMNLLGAAQQQRSQNINMDQWQKQFAEQQKNTKWSQDFSQKNTAFDQKMALDQFNEQKKNVSWDQSFQQTQYADNKQWREFQYNNMSASEKAQLEWAKQQYGEDAAWRDYELKYNGELMKGQYQAELDAYSGSALDFLP
ncbi:hypothetical protein [Metabacillus sp. cB07]|uniref:hypothetical protein n=1 Tax=Metabacillus sp. cB07 TaxID=2806989 RepID=UPI00193A5A4E|nr:hypothetical protein [Metabacillus sp. cB07]